MKSTIAILAASLLSVPAFAAAPKLEVATPIFDFGKIIQSQEIRHVFEIRNTGDAALELSLAGSSPHVTLATPLTPVPPGGTAKLEAVFDGAVPPGPARAEFALATNDPAVAKLNLGFAGEVELLLRAKPGLARWNTVQGEPEATIGQTIWTSDGLDFSLVEVKAPSFVRTTVRPATEAERIPEGKGPQWRVDLTLDSWAPVGAITGWAVVETNHPKQKRVLVPLSGFVRPIIFVDPPQGDLGTVDVASTAHRTFRVRLFGTQPIHVTAAEVTVPGAEVAVAQLQEGRLYEVKLSFPPAVSAGDFAGNLRILTDSSKLPVHEVPIRGVVRKSEATEKPPATASE